MFIREQVNGQRDHFIKNPFTINQADWYRPFSSLAQSGNQI